MLVNPTLFKAYDIRGRYPDVLDEEIVRTVARAYAEELKPRTVAIGRDVRISSPALAAATIEGLVQSGVEVMDLGLITTDQLYFAVGHLGLEGGIVISASHNPAPDNGMKFVGRGVEAIGLTSGLERIRDRVRRDEFVVAEGKGSVKPHDIFEEYLAHVYQFIDKSKIIPHRILVNGNNGAVGVVIRRLAKDLSLEMTELNLEPDGTFPQGQPDPLQPEQQKETSDLIQKLNVDFGVVWDGDADRVFFVTPDGQFVPGCFVTALLASEFLRQHQGATILSDPRVVWPVRDAVQAAGGKFIMTPAGHTLIKRRMRAEDAFFAGELSGHYFFRDNWSADNGIIPFLLILELLSERKVSLTELVAPLRSKYAFTPEINRRVTDVSAVIESVAAYYHDGILDRIDGISVAYENWRFNLRPSNTEPLIRLVVEGYDQTFVNQKAEEIINLIT